MNDATLSEVREYLNLLKGKGIPVTFGVAFGPEGGDIAVVVVSPALDAEKKQPVINSLWQMSGRRIVPIPCGERQWEEDAASALIAIARLSGERISL
jgi:hypothetical protein